MAQWANSSATGDSRTNADVVARALGIEEVEAEVLPIGNALRLRRAPLLGEGRRVARAALA